MGRKYLVLAAAAAVLFLLVAAPSARVAGKERDDSGDPPPPPGLDYDEAANYHYYYTFKFKEQSVVDGAAKLFHFEFDVRIRFWEWETTRPLIYFRPTRYELKMIDRGSKIEYNSKKQRGKVPHPFIKAIEKLYRKELKIHLARGKFSGAFQLQDYFPQNEPIVIELQHFFQQIARLFFNLLEYKEPKGSWTEDWPVWTKTLGLKMPAHRDLKFRKTVTPEEDEEGVPYYSLTGVWREMKLESAGGAADTKRISKLTGKIKADVEIVSRFPIEADFSFYCKYTKRDTDEHGRVKKSEKTEVNQVVTIEQTKRVKKKKPKKREKKVTAY